MLGPPWRPAPAAWSLDGVRYPTREPGVVEFARALQVELGGEHGREPILGAIHVILSVTAESHHPALFRRILHPDAPPLTRYRMEIIADDLTERVTGWTRWSLQRIWNQTMGSWALIDGRLQARGVDMTTLSFTQATHAAYATLADLYIQDKDAWKKWSDDLYRLPPRQVEREIREQSAREAQEQFEQAQALLAQFGPPDGIV